MMPNASICSRRHAFVSVLWVGFLAAASVAQTHDVLVRDLDGNWVKYTPPIRQGAPYVETYQGSLRGCPATFNVEYLDVTNNTDFGFDDPALGATRRTTVAAVFTYLACVLQECGTADVEFSESANAPTSGLGAAGTFYFLFPNGCQPGFTADHLMTGIDQSMTLHDATVLINFGRPFNSGLGPPAAGEFDLYSVVLHEFTHAMGFLTLSDANGNGRLSNPLIRTDFDGFIENGNGLRLFDCTDGSFDGTTNDLRGQNNGVKFGGPNTVAAWAALGFAGKPPLYAPSTFSLSASLSHWDGTHPDMPAGVSMAQVFSPGTTKRAYHALDLAVLRDIGYDIAAAQACCLSAGACENLDPCTCNERAGTPLGPGTVCGQTQACCLANGSCLDIDACACVGMGGTPSGAGTACALQACCMPDGTCTDLDPLCCADQGGVAQGMATSCTAPQACCMPNDTCRQLDPLCCDDLGGAPEGVGTSCTTPQGCCLPSGVCRNLDALCCQDLSGLPQGPSNLCTQQRACCLPDGTCRNLDPLCCDEAGGAAQGPGSSCGVTAACCRLGGTVCQIADSVCCGAVMGGAPRCGGSVCGGDVNGNGVNDACEAPLLCSHDADCVLADADVCTYDRCTPSCVCEHLPIEYADVFPAGGDGVVDLVDILCVLDGFSVFSICPNGDIAPTPGCTGDDAIDLNDILGVLDAFGGLDPCGCP